MFTKEHLFSNHLSFDQNIIIISMYSQSIWAVVLNNGACFMMLQMYAILNNYYNIQIVKFLITWMYFQLKKDTGTGKPKFVEVCMECHIGDTVGW